MSVRFSDKKQGIAAVAGHVGCGHCHSLNNQVQDDSAGLSVVLSLFKEAAGISLVLKRIEFEGDWIIAVMENGGIGKGKARRPLTLQEKDIIRRLEGKEIVNTHTLVLELFGRFYGQGVTETPVAVQTAIANAALNGFRKNYPEQFIGCVENVGENCGEIAGTVLDIHGIATSVLGTVNATLGGIGPNEDLEGNSPYYAKREIIEELGMDKLPTLVVEAMIYSGFSRGLQQNTYFVRGDGEDDNPYVVSAVLEAGRGLHYPMHHHEGGMKRTAGALRNNTKKVSEKIVSLGYALGNAETSEEKVNIIADLALAVSQDCGGISFMSNDLHEQLGGAGMIRRTSAVLNLVTCQEYIRENPIPFLTEEILMEYVNITKETIRVLAESTDEACRWIGV